MLKKAIAIVMIASIPLMFASCATTIKRGKGQKFVQKQQKHHKSKRLKDYRTANP
jgi:hypothetical protein